MTEAELDDEVIAALDEAEGLKAKIERLRAALLNIQSLAERGFPIDHAKLAMQCRQALGG